MLASIMSETNPALGPWIERFVGFPRYPTRQGLLAFVKISTTCPFAPSACPPELTSYSKYPPPAFANFLAAS